MPTAHRIRTPVPMPGGARADLPTEPSRAASDTICPRKRRRPLPNQSSKSTRIEGETGGEIMNRQKSNTRFGSLVRNGVGGGATVVAAALTVAIAMASPPPDATTNGVKNIVLVHGAFADGSSWAKVIPILQSKGSNVTAVQNPLTSFADDVAATNRALALQTGPVILVGHSWGGVVITEAGMDPKVVGLVYVAAFGPDAGEVVGDIGKAYPPPPSLG